MEALRKTQIVAISQVPVDQLDWEIFELLGFGDHEDITLFDIAMDDAFSMHLIQLF